MKIKRVVSLVLICMLVAGQTVYAQEYKDNTEKQVDEGQDFYTENAGVPEETEENNSIEEQVFTTQQQETEKPDISPTEEAVEERAEEYSTADIADITSGPCGDNVTWKVEGTTLSITGTGAMNNYTTEGYYGGGIETNVPWEAYMQSVTQIIIGEGVTTIGNCAFSDFNSLSYVSLPNSLTKVGCNAFTRCTSLVSIDLPDTITDIEQWAFGGCSSLISITIPKGVTELKKSCFSACTALEEIVLPDNLESIGYTVFNSCKSLRKVQLPDGLKKIGTAAFSICEGLEEINLPDSLVSIEAEAFQFCKRLKSITIPDTITTLDRETFYGCSSLTEITIPASVRLIRDRVFYGCGGLKDIYIYAQMTYIGNEKVFPDSSSVTMHCLENSSSESYLKYHGYNYSLLPCPQEEIQEEATGYKGQYDGEKHQISVSVKNLSPEQYTIYYSESEELYEGRFTYEEKPIQISNAGTHTIYYYICADGYPIKRGRADIVLEPLKGSLQFKDEVVEKRVYSDNFTNPLTAVTDGKITYSSSDETVAVVDAVSGKVTIKGSGDCIITASSEAGNYTAASASYTLKVSELLELAVLQHPEDYNGQLGEKVTLKTVASGEELAYQWRYSFDGEVSDTKYGLYWQNSDTLQLTLTDRASGAVYWCHIKDRFGNECNTEPCRLSYTIKNGYVSSGVCGEHLTWTLDDKGTLWISGEGEMTVNPWIDGNDQMKSKINKVIIRNGVTNIVSNAFYECAVTDVYIPDSVTSIGDVAFYGCGRLKEIAIPAAVEQIGVETFGRCDSLERVVMAGNAPKDTEGDAFEPYTWRPEKMVIHVPEGAEGYMDEPWSYYTKIYDVTNVAYKKGDVNADGDVGIEDLRIVLRYVCGKTELSARQEEAADVAVDSTVDIQDLRRMLRYVCGKIKEL